MLEKKATAPFRGRDRARTQTRRTGAAPPGRCCDYARPLRGPAAGFSDSGGADARAASTRRSSEGRSGAWNSALVEQRSRGEFTECATRHPPPNLGDALHPEQATFAARFGDPIRIQHQRLTPLQTGLSFAETTGGDGTAQRKIRGQRQFAHPASALQGQWIGVSGKSAFQLPARRITAGGQSHELAFRKQALKDGLGDLQ